MVVSRVIDLQWPFEGEYGIGDDFAAHEARDSNAPGIDYKLPLGTDVLAAADGIVGVVQREDASAGGLYVLINHGAGVYTLYCHLSEISVAPGWRVDAGQVIGKSGNTGHSTGAHLHFAARRGGKYVDPAGMLGIGD